MAGVPLDHLRSRKRPAYKRVAIPTDTDLVERFEKTKARVETLTLQSKMVKVADKDANLSEELAEARQDLEDLRAELAPTVLWFEIRSLGPKRYDGLLSKHPPTPDQRQKAKKDGSGPLAWNEDTFIPALISATCFYEFEDEDGKQFEQLTPEFVKEMEEGENWSRGDIMTLFTAAYEVNAATRRNLDLGNV